MHACVCHGGYRPLLLLLLLLLLLAHAPVHAHSPTRLMFVLTQAFYCHLYHA
jgi:hypothetical protein